jgi:hypothetical protein
VSREQHRRRQKNQEPKNQEPKERLHSRLRLFGSLPGIPEEERELILRCMLNFILMRNYAAHHDCLDWDLVYSEVGNHAVTSVLTIVLLLLKAN